MKASPRLTTFGAFDAFAGGVDFVVGSPRVWPYAAVPAAVMALLTFLFTAVAVWGSAHLAAWIFGHDLGTWGTVGKWIVIVLLVLVFFLIGVLLALSLAEPISALALERISQAQERALTGGAPPASPL